MKVRVYVEHLEEYEVADEIFETLFNLHSTDPHAIGTPEQYELADKRINAITNKPTFDYDENNFGYDDYIVGVYALNDEGMEVPILEY